MPTYILALDQGTTGNTAILFDENGKEVVKAYREFRQYYPRPGWVEHDAVEIWHSMVAVIEEAISGVDPSDIAAIGLTNQRETAVIWDRETGQPVHNAIVWQCRRTAPICDFLKNSGMAKEIQRRTGLVLDAYFSGTKVKWLLDNVPGIRHRAEAGRLCFGTIDSWLIWNLSGGKVHVTDYSNASRTLLFNINSLQWDEELCGELGVPASILPRVVPSSGEVARTAATANLPAGVPIAGIAGDQQAALFGQVCFESGTVKNTYGTGCFLLMPTGEVPVFSEKGLLTTIAWNLGGEVEYALEGSVFVAGAAIQWLRDELGVIETASQSEACASVVADNGGVYFVPAFVGLGAPYWDQYARGTIVGLTRGANKNHIVRAALESMAYQTRDVLEVMSRESNIPFSELRVDGGASVNNFLMQFQADILDVKVKRPVIRETTALGAAYLAGLGVGLWKNKEDIARKWLLDREFAPQMNPEAREQHYRDWKRAVERAQRWQMD